jgi:DNA modification methylase
MEEVPSKSVDLVVTSPPYPMIEMWDEQFSLLSPATKSALSANNGRKAFELMHGELNKTWTEVERVLKDGGIACINIGDATRKVGSSFKLFGNHSKTIENFEALGMSLLPSILWRKQTNKPNKYMGSGMLPPTAYVTLEHEFILIFRKGGQRTFEGEDKIRRRESAFFWEERNQWFSDVWWDLKGTSQKINQEEMRERSAAYPFELVYRLINMYSIRQDTILDPFLGTGTSTMAALCSCRNSIGYELVAGFKPLIKERIKEVVRMSKDVISDRLRAHQEFIRGLSSKGKETKYQSRVYGFPVMTAQEVDISIPVPGELTWTDDLSSEVSYGKPLP